MVLRSQVQERLDHRHAQFIHIKPKPVSPADLSRYLRILTACGYVLWLGDEHDDGDGLLSQWVITKPSWLMELARSLINAQAIELARRWKTGRRYRAAELAALWSQVPGISGYMSQEQPLLTSHVILAHITSSLSHISLLLVEAQASRCFAVPLLPPMVLRKNLQFASQGPWMDQEGRPWGCKQGFS